MLRRMLASQQIAQSWLDCKSKKENENESFGVKFVDKEPVNEHLLFRSDMKRIESLLLSEVRSPIHRSAVKTSDQSIIIDVTLASN